MYIGMRAVIDDYAHADGLKRVDGCQLDLFGWVLCSCAILKSFLAGQSAFASRKCLPHPQPINLYV
jgi:hypothetical protein